MCRDGETLTWHEKMSLKANGRLDVWRIRTGLMFAPNRPHRLGDSYRNGRREALPYVQEPPTGAAMTDARFPERWLNDKRVTRLSGDAFKLFMFAMGWSVANRTDGVVTEDDLEDVPRVDRTLSAELEKAGLWRREASHWLMLDFEETQTSKAQLEGLDAKRRHERQRAQRYRDNKKSSGRHADGAHDDNRTGQDRTGVEGEPSTNAASNDVKTKADWPVVAVPGQRSDEPQSFAIIERMKAEAEQTAL